jgi:hypothetical protein
MIPRPAILSDSRLEMVPKRGKSNPIAADFKRGRAARLSAYAVWAFSR